MNKSNKFSPEVRERAVRMVQEHRGEYPSLWAAIESVNADLNLTHFPSNRRSKSDPPGSSSLRC
ncbi:hypothetical protein NBM50_03280, partial [Xylophilus ampelinus]|nr:hypothetical protein [Xylophilus ampelinus]